MGWVNLDYTNTDWAWKPATRCFELPEGILYAVTLITKETEVAPTMLYGEVGLIASVCKYENMTCVLANGYFGSISHIGWTGRLPITTDTYLYTKFKVPNNWVVRLSFLTLKPSESKTSMEILDA